MRETLSSADDFMFRALFFKSLYWSRVRLRKLPTWSAQSPVVFAMRLRVSLPFSGAISKPIITPAAAAPRMPRNTLVPVVINKYLKGEINICLIFYRKESYQIFFYEKIGRASCRERV